MEKPTAISRIAVKGNSIKNNYGMFSKWKKAK